MSINAFYVGTTGQIDEERATDKRRETNFSHGLIVTRQGIMVLARREEI